MDLVTGAKEVYVLMSHCTRDAEPKLVKRCSYPLTGLAVVSKMFTDLAVIHVIDGRFVLVEALDGLDVGMIQTMTGADILVREPVRTFLAPDLL